MRFIHPYIAFATYRFHVEKSREIGIRIEDFYHQKFHKEPYFMFHVYAQYFHPETLVERVRDVNFYRRTRTLYKGFKVPEWAQASKMNGWELDAYSREAWDNAMHDFNAEATPMPFFGERQEPNILEWFRLEQFGKGASSRLFYNEVPEPTWFRHQGHIDDKDSELYSFTNANQDTNMVFGMDTTTEEGRKLFEAEYLALAECCPEVLDKNEIIYPHQIQKSINTEPHFQRLWKTYQCHVLKDKAKAAVDSGKVSNEDMVAAGKFLGAKGSQMQVAPYVYTKAGLRPALEQDEGYLATDRVMEAIGMNETPINLNSAEDPENQFWSRVDYNYKLTEEGMKENLAIMITDPSNKMKVEAIMEGRTGYLEAESTK